jgi:hypothetical protein
MIDVKQNVVMGDCICFQTDKENKLTLIVYLNYIGFWKFLTSPSRRNTEVRLEADVLVNRSKKYFGENLSINVKQKLSYQRMKFKEKFD